MKVAILVLSVVVSIIIFIAVICGISYVQYANYGNEQENTINTAYENNQNILSQYSLKVIEASKVGDKYADKLKDILEGAISSRYGDEGSQAAMHWISEQNPTLDSSVYLKIQQIIEAGRNEYQVAQSSLLDKCNVYKTNIGYLWTGFWLRITGYPKDGIEKKCTPIKSNYGIDAYETGVEKGVL